MNRKEIHTYEPLRKYWNKAGFILCTGGYADVSMNEQNCRLTRGSILVITPLVLIDDIHPSEDYTELSLVSDLKDFYPIFHLISDTPIPLRVSESPCWQLSDEEIAYVIRQDALIHSKQRRMAEASTADDQRLQGYLIQLLRHETMLEVVSNHFRHIATPEDEKNYQAVVAYRFILSLHEHYHSERTVSWYASEATLSPGHFTSIIKSATGKTPSQWISAVTVTYAKFLLERSAKSIKEIAQQLNFPEQFTFRKYFKQHAGMSPKEYRLLSRE